MPPTDAELKTHLAVCRTRLQTLSGGRLHDIQDVADAISALGQVSLYLVEILQYITDKEL